MALCRIYLCTYRRNHLLPRALQSLLNQTVQDWVCEIHNDDPSDPFPAQLVEQINDPRITIVNHAKNLGPMPVFNLVFRSVEESFVSLLEDDNWWEPNFLETMIQVMEQHPTVNLAWANMKFWQEESDQTWTDTGKTIWDGLETSEIQSFQFPDKRQIFGAIHSQGAMLVRSSAAGHYQVPDSTTSDAGEHVRERCFDYPILLVPQVLGNYSLTRDTSRSKDGTAWTAMQILLAASFLKHVPLRSETVKQLWVEARTALARSTSTLFLIALLYPECRSLLNHATPGDWLFFLASLIKHPLRYWRIVQRVNAHTELWQFLDCSTATKVQTAQQYGFSAI